MDIGPGPTARHHERAQILPAGKAADDGAHSRLASGDGSGVVAYPAQLARIAVSAGCRRASIEAKG
jgi:hypothetical protein